MRPTCTSSEYSSPPSSLSHPALVEALSMLEPENISSSARVKELEGLIRKYTKTKKKDRSALGGEREFQFKHFVSTQSRWSLFYFKEYKKELEKELQTLKSRAG